MKREFTERPMISASGMIYSLPGLRRLAAVIADAAAKDVDNKARGCKCTVNSEKCPNNEQQISETYTRTTPGSRHPAEFRKKHH